jgi:alpha-glucosidase
MINFRSKWRLISIAIFFYSPSIFAQPQFIIQQTAQKITIAHHSGKPLLSLDKTNFIEAISCHEKVKNRFGSFSIQQKNKITVKQVSQLEVLDYGNSVFLVGQVSNGTTSFPFEIGCLSAIDKPDEAILTVKLTDSTKKITAISLTLDNTAKHIYGFGEQFSHTDFIGKKITTLTEENGIGRGDQPASKLTKLIGAAGHSTASYFPLPTFFTEDGMTYTATPSFFSFDFTKQGKMRLETNTIQAEGKHLFNLSLDWRQDALQPEMHTLPDWAYGTVLGLQGGQKKVEAIINDALKAGNPVTAVWLQDWIGKRQLSFGERLWWKWEVDTLHYPNMKNWIAKLHQKNIKVLGYINPFVIKKSQWFAEAAAKNYLVKNLKGKDYKLNVGGFDAYLLDLASEDACEWFKQIIKTQLIEVGFSGWMADFGEYLPLDAKLGNGFSGREFHNFYPVAWARINREAAQEAGIDDSLVIFHRSGNAGSAKYVKLFWTGDQTPDFGQQDGLPSAIKAVLTSAASGTLYNHSDIGGYTNINFGAVHINRTRELLYRWAEFAVFTPFFRTHEGLNPQKNSQVYSDSDAIHFFAQLGRLHYALKDYSKENVAQFGQLIYPLYLLPGFEQHDLHYFFGSDLLIAPATKSGQTTVSVKFPEGEWIYAWDNEKIYAPNSIADIIVPFGKPAVFIRKNGQWETKLTAIFNQ